MFISHVPDPEDSPVRQDQVRALIQFFPYNDHLVETAGTLRQEMIARLRALGIGEEKAFL